MALHYLEDQYIQIDDLSVRCWRAGSQGDPVLFIHGIGAAVEYWSGTLTEMGQHFRTLAIDLPGFGKSSKPNILYNIDYYANFLIKVIEQEQIGPCHVVAHSLGGGLALHLAATAPHLVRKLVLMDSVGFAHDISIFYRILTLPYLGAWLLNASETSFAAALRHDVYEKSALPDSFIERMFPLSMDPLTRRTTLQIINDNLNLCQIKMPILHTLWQGMETINKINTLVFWGKQDPILPFKTHTLGIKKWLPDAKLIGINDCGHIPQIEHSHFVNAELLNFLKS